MGRAVVGALAGFGGAALIDALTAMGVSSLVAGAAVGFGEDAILQAGAIASGLQEDYNWCHRLAATALGVAFGGLTALTRGRGVVPRTGTVWDRIKPTQEVWPGSEVPRSFEFTTQNGQRFWVHGNATEHIAERVVGANGPRMQLKLGRIVQQSQLKSLEAAVNEATKTGVRFDEIIRLGGELKFARPRNPGDLPAIIHTLPLE